MRQRRRALCRPMLLPAPQWQELARRPSSMPPAHPRIPARPAQLLRAPQAPRDAPLAWRQAHALTWAAALQICETMRERTATPTARPRILAPSSGAQGACKKWPLPKQDVLHNYYCFPSCKTYFLCCLCDFLRGGWEGKGCNRAIPMPPFLLLLLLPSFQIAALHAGVSVHVCITCSKHNSQQEQASRLRNKTTQNLR